MTGETSTPSSSKGCEECEGGWIFLENRTVEMCKCQLAKEAKRRIQRSGLAGVIEKLTFDNFEATSNWQKTMVDTAKAYVADVKNGGDPWFYIGGQVGCGKTHLCTAISGELLNVNHAVRYVIWPSEVNKIKGYAMEIDKRNELLYPLINAPVLYVDDFLKTANRGTAPTVTDAEVRVAFELFNERYYRNLPTIISCEWDIESLLDVDQGTISRIYQKSDGYRLSIGKDAGKNYRMKGA